MTVKANKRSNNAKPRKNNRASRLSGKTNTLSNIQPTAQSREIVSCMKKYLNGFFNPFQEGDTPCFFGESASSHFPVKTTVRVAFSDAAAFDNIVGINPSPWRNRSSIYRTNGTDATALSSVYLGAAYAMTGSPFDYTSDLSFRLVAGGVRFKNITAGLYKQGVIRGYMNPDNTSLPGSTTFGTVASNIRAQYQENRMYIPYYKFDSDFVDEWREGTDYAYSSTYGDAIVSLPQQTGGAASWLIEAVFFWEFRGASIQALVVTSPSDSSIFGKVRETIQDLIVKSNDHLPSAQQIVMSAMRILGPTVTNYVMNNQSVLMDFAAKAAVKKLMQA